MNIILILVDSLNKDCLSVYNPDTECATPTLSSFAERATVFDNHYIASLPCMPARREIFTGRKEFMWRPWGPLEVFDPRLPVLLRDKGYNTGIVTDHYHYWEEMANGYIQGFSSLEFIRGHETDFWKLPGTGPVPPWVDKIAEFRAAVHPRQYYANVKNFQGEEDFFPAKVFTAASNWLDENAGRGPFFLQVENFDVHEPFDVPEPYATMYTDRSKDEFNIWPPYQIYADLDAFIDQTTPEELRFLESQYMGKTTMVDKWLGRFLSKLDDLGLWDDTVVLFATDHGHDLGQRGVFGKQFPHFDSHANIPMMVWHPDFPGGRHVSGLTQTVDLFATIAELGGADVADVNRHSRSVLPVMAGGSVRDAILYGTYGQGVCMNDGEWTLFKAPVEGEPLFTYSTMINQPLIVDNPVDGRVGRMPDPPVDQGFFDPTVPLPMWKIPITIDPRTYDNHLYNRLQDPGQQNNLWDTATDQRERMLDLMKTMISDEGAPEEQFARLGLQ